MTIKQELSEEKNTFLFTNEIIHVKTPKFFKSNTNFSTLTMHISFIVDFGLMKLNSLFQLIC